jgi:hypothetical protein
MRENIVRVQRVGKRHLLTIPNELVEKIRTEYMFVKLEETGKLVYEPVSRTS